MQSNLLRSAKQVAPIGEDQARNLLTVTELVVPITCEGAGLEWIRPLTRLKKLVLSSDIGALSPLGSLESLETLQISHRSEVSWPEGLLLPSLRVLFLPDGADLSLLSRHPQLEVLHLGGVTDLAPLKPLSLLELEVSGGELDLAPLSGQTRLQTLTLRLSRVPDLAPLATLPGLRALELELSETPIALEPLSALPLERLTLAGRLQSTEPLSQMKTLRVLDVVETDLSSLEPVQGLELQQLHIRQDNVPAAQYAAFIAAHPKTIVTEPGE